MNCRVGRLRKHGDASKGQNQREVSKLKNFRLQRKNPRLCDRDGLDQVENAWILMQIGPVAPYYELGSGKTLTVPTARFFGSIKKVRLLTEHASGRFGSRM